MKRKTGLILCTLVTLLSGCTPDLFKGMESTGKQSATIDNLHPYYSTTGQTTLYSIEMNVRGNTMNGVLSVLPEPDGSVRTAFTTVFGFTLFDLKIGKDSMQIYECLPQMKSKLLRKMLEKDLRILFFKNISSSFLAKTYKLTYNNGSSTIMSEKDAVILSKGYYIKNNYGKFQYKTDEVEQHISQIHSKGKILQADFTYTYAEGSDIPTKIRINHPVIKASLQLEQMAQPDSEKESRDEIPEDSTYTPEGE